MLLPAFCLSSDLSDRQQASSANLKPSEVRLSQSRPDTGTRSVEHSPSQQDLQHHDSEPGLRGILKKSCSGGPEWNRTEESQVDSSFSYEQNGKGCEDAAIQGSLEETERQEISTAPWRERPTSVEGSSLTAAPWRQKARNRKETSASAPVRALSEQDPPLDERFRQAKPQEQSVLSLDHSSDTDTKVQ